MSPKKEAIRGSLQSLALPLLQRSWFAAIGFVLSVACVLPDAAVAETCGHYLYRNGRPVTERQTSLNEGADFLTVGVFSENPLKPCNGPRCGSQSTPHTTPVASSIRIFSSDIAELINSTHIRRSGISQLWRPESETGEFIEARPLFRPPAP